jgi:hypothetical protein
VATLLLSGVGLNDSDGTLLVSGVGLVEAEDTGATAPPAQIGSTPVTAIYIGSTPITAINLGSTQLWP